MTSSDRRNGWADPPEWVGTFTDGESDRLCHGYGGPPNLYAEAADSTLQFQNVEAGVQTRLLAMEEIVVEHS